MEQKEKDIINYLRRGKNVNISQIARELNLPTSTVADRIKRIEEKYIIKRSSLLDYNKIGYTANAFLAIKISAKQKNEFLTFLKNQNCINSIHHINSRYSFLVELVCKDNFELIKWIEKSKEMFELKIIQFQVLKTEEKEKFVPE